MNIFFLDWNPKIAALYAVDKHIVKMILESVQLLYSAYHLCDPKLLEKCPYTPYRLTHKNHPCAKWVRESYSNFYWLLILSWEYCKEYTFRYEKVHACQKHVLWMIHNLPNIPKVPFTSPAQAMPDKYKDNDPVQAYKNYYIGEKLHFARYTKRTVPVWLQDYL